MGVSPPPLTEEAGVFLEVEVFEVLAPFSEALAAFSARRLALDADGMVSVAFVRCLEGWVEGDTSFE